MKEITYIRVYKEDAEFTKKLAAKLRLRARDDALSYLISFYKEKKHEI